MNICVLFRLADGAPIQSMLVADPVSYPITPDQVLLPVPDGTDDSNAYLEGGEVKAKQPFPFTVDKTTLTADGVDEVAVTGVPANTQVTWPDGQTDTVTDGEVRFSVDLAGTYTLKFSAVAYLAQEVTLEAVAAA